MTNSATGDPRKLYTETMIRDSLIALLEDRPLHEITITALCQRAGINRSTFYAHYKNVMELMEHIEGETLEWIRGVIVSTANQGGNEEKLRRIELTCQYIASNSSYLGVLMNSNANVDFQYRFMSLIYEEPTLQDIVDTEEKRLKVQFAVNGAIGLIRHWLKTGLRTPYTKIAQIIYSMSIVPMEFLNDRPEQGVAIGQEHKA
ncbi:TetR/AcrR family transcriptional regulator [Bifidobacterium aquikefiricola]|uniref:TetR/AcrR family transcriptional regulator n=1 Tax=Bifidobacterium aquikefiricola TaxID=3059038 RepID=A0AB39U8R2_9BIFI